MSIRSTWSPKDSTPAIILTLYLQSNKILEKLLQICVVFTTNNLSSLAWMEYKQDKSQDLGSMPFHDVLIFKA